MLLRRNLIKLPMLVLLFGLLAANLPEPLCRPSEEDPWNLHDVLSDYQNRYHSETLHLFIAGSRDTVIGEPAISAHQIVLISKEDCAPCREARERIEKRTLDHPTAVHLIIKDISSLSPSALQQLGVEQLPAVFVDGRFAEGWYLPGFLDTFVQDCGC
jgi:hypothetical protein